MALARIGIDQAIQSLTERSKAASICNLFYEPMRDAVLRDFAWSFANARRALGLVEENPNDDWAYAYTYPDNCIRPLRIISTAGRLTDRTNPIPYELEQGDNGILIMTDQAEALLKYTVRVTNVNLFAADFVSAFAWRLGQEIATPLARTKGVRDDARQSYLDEISRAQATASNEIQVDPNPEAEWIRGRE